MTITEIQKIIQNKSTTCSEQVKMALKSIENGKDYNAIISVMDSAVSKAEAMDKQPIKCLTGVTVAIKDNICTYDKPTTCASKMLENFVPPFNATVVNRLEEAGAVIVAKTNMDEFALGSASETGYFGAVKNNIDTSRAAGGSSGGSAVSVSSGMVDVALGSDTGGSVRVPASFTGVVGFKPSYGLISRNGLVALGSSLDQIGTFTNSVYDAGMLLNVLGGLDGADTTLVDRGNIDYTAQIGNDVKGATVAVFKELNEFAVQADVLKAHNDAVNYLKDQGVNIIEVSLPFLNDILAVYKVIMTSEASSNFARMDGVRYGYRASKYDGLVDLYVKSRTEGFGAKVKECIILGQYFLTLKNYKEYFLKALSCRRVIVDSLNKIFANVDAILLPTTLTTAFEFGKEPKDSDGVSQTDIFTVAANIAGLPAISVPFGKDSSGLPIGMQLMSKQFDDNTLLKIAGSLEKGGAK